MLRFALRRLLYIPLILVVVNFLGYAYALVAQAANAASNPFFASSRNADILMEYAAYAQGLLHLDLGSMPGSSGQVSAALANAAGASLALMIAGFTLSLLAGLGLALLATRVESAHTASWLPVISAAGLSMPGFYAGALLIVLVLALASRALPVTGSGTAAHLLLPTLALAVRPTLQLAQITAGLLAGEAGKQYLTAARSFGFAQAHLRWRHMLPNVLSAVILTAAASLRLLIVEMIIVERLFSWQGMGRLLSFTLVAPRLSQPEGGELFLHPPLLAALLVVFVAFFLFTDLLAALLVRAVDPRNRDADAERGREAAHAQ